MVQGVFFTVVVTTGKFLNVAVQMLCTQMMERAFVGAFQNAPEALDSVRVGHVLDILTGAVADALMGEQHPLESRGVIRVDGRAVGGIVRDELL